MKTFEIVGEVYVLASDAMALQAEIDALKAAQTWRPIQTAPKTGFFKAWHVLWACEITVQFTDDALWFIEKTKTTKWPIEAFSCWAPTTTPETEK